MRKRFILTIFLITLSINLSIANDSHKLVWVKNVFSNSPAEKAGIRPYDLIYAIDNTSVFDEHTQKDFVQIINSLPEGEHRFNILRKGEKIELRIFLPYEFEKSRLGVEYEVIEDNPQIYFDNAINKLKIASNRDDLKKISEELEKAKALSPSWEDVYYNLSLVYDKLDYYDKVIDNLTEHLRLMVRRSAPFEDTEKIAILLGRAKKKYDKLKEIKAKMVEGKWSLKKKFPSTFDQSFYPKFSLGEKMWMCNIVEGELEKLYKFPKDELTKRYIALYHRVLKTHPYFEVVWDGRFFEVRQFLIVIGEDTQRPGQLFFLPRFYLFKGEVDFDRQPVLIKVWEYSYLVSDGCEDEDNAIRLFSHRLKEYKFEDTHFNRELNYVLE